MIKTVFNHISESNDIEFTLRVSLFEIYMEKMYDLLNPNNKIKIRENKQNDVYVEGIENPYISSYEELINYINIATKNRKTNETMMN